MAVQIDRRTLLQSAGAAALVSALPNEAAGASRKSRLVQATPSNWAGSFNNGKTQVGLNALQWGGAYPFLNCLKTAQTWILMDNSGSPEPNTLDGNGYPTKITNGGVYTVFWVPSQANRPGNYVVSWAGNGTIFCGMSNAPVSGGKTSTNGSGRYVFATTDTRFVIGITAIGSPAITDLKVCHIDDELALNSGVVFSSFFKQRLLEARFGVIRFMAWQDSNITNVTTWATRKPLNYVYYAGEDLRPSLYAGTTSNSGSAYSANLPGFVLADKATVILKFNASGSGSCTLNVSGTGDFPILSAYCRPLDSGNYPIGGTSQSMATLVYDATLKAWIKQGGGQDGSVPGLRNGCPPELMVQLCAEVGAHPYFVAPPLACDPLTDWVPSLAAYCRANSPAWMVPRFEGPNETWNFAGGFYSTYYAVAKAAAYGWGPDFHNWYGKVMSVLGQAVSSAYGGNRSAYQVLCGVQTVTGYDTIWGTTGSNARLQSNLYVAQTTPAQTPYTKTPASQWVTHVVCANYITPSEWGTPQEVTDAAAYAAASDAATKAAIAAQYCATVNSGTGFTLATVASFYANWKSWAISHGIAKMCCYEGGYSPDYGGDATVNALRGASRFAPALQTFTTTNFNNFRGLTDANFTAEFPSCFVLSGNIPSSSVWAILEDIYQTPGPPQWLSIVQYAAL